MTPVYVPVKGESLIVSLFYALVKCVKKHKNTLFKCVKKHKDL